MTLTPRPRLLLAGAAGALSLALAVLTIVVVSRDTSEREDRSVYDGTRSTAAFDDDPATFAAALELPDGRRVRVWVSRQGDALREQHYSPAEDAWTRPRTIYRPERPDPCQGVALAEGGGVIAVSAEFGMFCYLGEDTGLPVALVSHGDLTTWEVHQGGPDAEPSGLTVTEDQVRWTDGDQELTWTPEQGFSTG